MIVTINVFLIIATVFTFFGMIGETKDAEAKKGCTYGFIICLIGLVIINAVNAM